MARALASAPRVIVAHDRLYETLSPGWSYEAIAVALVARLNPLAIVPSAVLFRALDNGAQAMQRTQGVSPILVQVIEGLVTMILLAFDATAWTALRQVLWEGELVKEGVASSTPPIKQLKKG